MEALLAWLRAWLAGDAPPNVWLGISVVNQAEADRDIPKLQDVPTRVRFLSCEPLLGPIIGMSGWLKGFAMPGVNESTPAPKLDWVIVGGESGPGARPFEIAWARSIAAQCKAAGVACFVKQLGADPRIDGAPYPAERRMGGWDRKGGDMATWPADLRIREFPT